MSVQAMDFPNLTGQVVDEAGIINQHSRSTILSKLREGQQFVVVTLDNLRGYEIEEYGLELARYWGIGHKDYDDGVLLIVAPNERQVRIEVGYGLEGVLTDAKSSEIIRHILLPAFKRGDYNGGIVDAVDVMTRIIDGEQVDVNPVADIPWGVIIFALTFFSLFFALIVLIVFVIFMEFKKINAMTPKEREKYFKEMAKKRSSGHSSSSFSSSSSGGGFRGGGGSFGGGGASGRW